MPRVLFVWFGAALGVNCTGCAGGSGDLGGADVPGNEVDATDGARFDADAGTGAEADADAPDSAFLTLRELESENRGVLRIGMAVMVFWCFAATAIAGDDDPIGSYEQARAMLDEAAAALEAYAADSEAAAAAPDALDQLGEAIDEARGLLVERGTEGAEWAIRRVRALVDLVAELVEARVLEREAASLAEAAIEALERLAIARAAYERITEQLHLFAVPFPGEPGS